MALIKMNFVSQKLKRSVDINVILPIDKYIHEEKTISDKPFRTMYLLHGIYGDCNDWINFTSIRQFAENKNIAVVMPSAENRFYVDNEYTGEMYGEFIGEELVELTRKTFNLSHERDDTIIAGLSMGGYGALVNGLRFRETFGHICGLSSALIIDDILNGSKPILDVPDEKRYYEVLFGDLSKLKDSQKNYKKLIEDTNNLPSIYLCIGRNDFLIEQNRDFVELLKSKDIEFTYLEDRGSHSWDFWNRNILRYINHLNKE